MPEQLILQAIKRLNGLKYRLPEYNLLETVLKN